MVIAWLIGVSSVPVYTYLSASVGYAIFGVGIIVMAVAIVANISGSIEENRDK